MIGKEISEKERIEKAQQALPKERRRNIKSLREIPWLESIKDLSKKEEEVEKKEEKAEISIRGMIDQLIDGIISQVMQTMNEMIIQHESSIIEMLCSLENEGLSFSERIEKIEAMIIEGFEKVDQKVNDLEAGVIYCKGQINHFKEKDKDKDKDSKDNNYSDSEESSEKKKVVIYGLTGDPIETIKKKYGNKFKLIFLPPKKGQKKVQADYFFVMIDFVPHNSFPENAILVKGCVTEISKKLAKI